MSEFFSVTLNKDIVLDDSVISNKTGWSSEKIQKEIIEKRITKFEELEDVDVVNKQDKQLVAYSDTTGKFTTIDGIDAGQLVGATMKQISKMGIVGTQAVPAIVNIPINTLDFKFPQVNVLKFDDLGNQDIIITKNEFNSGEVNDFIEDDMIIFDGKAHLKTDFNSKFNVIRDEKNFIEYSVIVNKSKLKKVENFDVLSNVDIKTLNMKAVPKDRLLIPKSDLNLTNVIHIDYFKLIAQGINMRIVCSVNSGVTWKTFNVDKWIDINLDYDSVNRDGMTIAVFNNINDISWNELVTTDKIRFAYLFSMDNITDKEEIDNLDLQYDGLGKWIQAKDDTFDVIYASNTLLQIHVKFSGDIKINY